jgi:hypothetical protein
MAIITNTTKADITAFLDGKAVKFKAGKDIEIDDGQVKALTVQKQCAVFFKSGALKQKAVKAASKTELPPK